MSIELAPVKESTADYEAIERRIKKVFREKLYLPLLRQLRVKRDVLQNAKTPLLDAIESGQVYFEAGALYGGTIQRVIFHGKFDAEISKELKALGAKWHARSAAFHLPQADFPPELFTAMVERTKKMLARLAAAEKSLQQNLPEEIAAEVKVTDLFGSTLSKTDRQLQQTLKDITVLPQLTPHRRQRIAEEWQQNMELWIKDFAEEEIAKLRKDIQKNVFAGNRFESVIGSIQKSYGVTANKAKFLARQETSLLLTKFKESRYTDSGIHKYRWRCVAGSKNHPVRPSHKILDGKVFRWDDPPLTTPPSEAPRKNNPGQDFNCRCSAIPIVDFREKPA